MKRIFGLLFIMFSTYIFIQLLYNYFSKGYEIEYEVNGYNVYERYIARTKGEKDSYYVMVKDNEDIFYLNIYKSFNKKRKIVKNITIIEGIKYKCAYFEFKTNSFKTNIICTYDNIMYNYQDIVGKDKLLDENISKLDFDISLFIDNAEEKERMKDIFVMQSNLNNNQFIGLSTPKGVYLINNYSDVKYLYQVDLFNIEKESQPISIFTSKYYLVADYDYEKSFNKFYVINITFGDKSVIKYHSNISFNSYIMGNVGNKVYLLDLDNKKQYEIDLTKKSIIEIGNKNLGIKYYKDGKFIKLDIEKALKEKPKFINNSIDKEGYDKVDLVGGEKTGYKYYYKKNKNSYDVYRSMQNSDKLTYIFKTTNIDNIVYFNDYVYYEDGDYIKCYQDNIGVKKIYRSNNKKGSYKFGVSTE